MTANLFAKLEGRFPSDRSRTFIETGDGTIYSYADLMEITARYANLLSGLGVQPGDRITAQADKSAELIFLYLACIRMGAVNQPLNTAYTLSELEYFLRDAEPAIVVCRPQSEAQ